MTTKRRWLLAAIALWLAHGCASTPQIAPEPSRDDKLSRLLKLEDERSLGDGEVVLGLSDSIARVRARAAVVSARVGGVDANQLTALLDDPTDFVRESAAFALGILDGELSSDAIQALTSSLEDDSLTVRARAIEALGKKGDADSAEAIARALARTAPRGGEPYEWAEDLEVSIPPGDDPRLDLRLGIVALARRASLRWSWDLLATQGSTPRYVWWPAAWAMSELPGDERAPLLRYFAGSLDPELRVWGARGYGSLHAEDVPQHLRLLLSDPSERVRIATIRSIASLGLAEMAPQLITLLDSDTLHVQATALQALATLDAPMTVETLIDQIGNENAWLRGLALPALAKQDIDGFWLLLAGLGHDQAWQVRAALADLLGRVQGERPRTLLRSMAEEPDARVRARALTALARAEGDPEDASPILIEHLKGPDPFERLAAAQALARMGRSEAGISVQQAFLEEDSSEPRVKAQLLAALGSLDPTLARETARAALDETDFLLRRQAAAILSRLEGSQLTARPRPSDHGVAHYRSLANPRYTPQAFIRTARGEPIEVELFVADAPLTVQNFIRLARSGFYDGLSVHHVVPNGRVETGDPRGDGNGGPGYAIRSEVNPRPIVRGTLAMLNHGTDTAGSQFFITHLPQPKLEGTVTVFGQVTGGMNTVDRLEPGDTIESITIWDGYTSPYRAP